MQVRSPVTFCEGNILIGKLGYCWVTLTIECPKESNVIVPFRKHVSLSYDGHGTQNSFLVICRVKRAGWSKQNKNGTLIIPWLHWHSPLWNHPGTEIIFFSISLKCTCYEVSNTQCSIFLERITQPLNSERQKSKWLEYTECAEHFGWKITAEYHIDCLCPGYSIRAISQIYWNTVLFYFYMPLIWDKITLKYANLELNQNA